MIPVNEAYLTPCYEADSRAHWYVAIICNLDQVKSRENVKPRTRSRLDRMSPEIGEDQRTEDIIIEEIDNDEGDLIVQDPVPMDAMPDIFADADADVVELPARNHTGEAGEPIDVDGPSQSEMQAEFKQLSLSNTQKYDYKDDPSIDEATRQAMEEVLNGRPKRYTRRDTTVLRDSPIMLDDENDTITDTLRGLRRKLDSTSMTSPTTPPSRRVSGKVIPTNAYQICLTYTDLDLLLSSLTLLD